MQVCVEQMRVSRRRFQKNELLGQSIERDLASKQDGRKSSSDFAVIGGSIVSDSEKTSQW
jgi:hypothetical protein